MRALPLVLVCLLWASVARAAPDLDNAAAYLEARSNYWLTAPPRAGNNMNCAVSCHTTVLWAATAPSGETADRLRARIASRVDAEGPWSSQVAFYGRPGSDTALQALATESVLNAVTLAFSSAEPPALHRALDRMWELQRSDGAWNWLDFDLEPFEAGNDMWGATLAAIALGHAGADYKSGHASQAKRLVTYLREARAVMTLHDRLYLAWASTHLDGLLDDADRTTILDRIEYLRSPDGALSLKSLIEAGDDAPDGYATALGAFVSCRLGRAHPTTWLRNSQTDRRSWPAASPNGGSVIADLHFTDAATAFAILALRTCP